MKVSLFFMVLFNSILYGQSSDLPITFLNSSDTSKSFIFYISGDGGMNKFSSSLIQSLNRNGYTVAALNAKKYFWEKKTPVQSASDIVTYLTKFIKAKPTRQIVFVGYSFGADVLPFIVNALPETNRHKIRSVVLLSPSPTTDFEIHWSDILGWEKKREMNVIAAINQLNSPVVAIFGDDEKGFSKNSIHLKKLSYKVLPGCHHFDGNTDGLAKTIINSL